MFTVLLALHVTASIAYYYYAMNNPADSALYYQGAPSLLNAPITSGTVFTVQLVHELRSILGGTYLDYFLLFQATGFWGLALLMRVFDELRFEFPASQNSYSWAVLFLPSLHFWTAAIGKDAPLFFAVSLAVWSSMRLRRRLIFMACAIVVMLLFRAHVALIATLCLALAAAFSRGGSLLTKAGLVTVALVGAAFTLAEVQASLDFDLNQPGSFASFVERQQAALQSVGGGTSQQGSSLIVRLLSLLFRPFFFDINSLLSLVASLENVLVGAITIFFVMNWRHVVRMARLYFFVRFAIFFTVAMIVFLTITYYNVGLGLRQRVMYFPTILTLFVALRLTRNKMGNGALELDAK
jgi:hypothetical protein